MEISIAEQLNQIERDIKDHNEAERVEWIRADRERPNWTEIEKIEFARAREGAADHLKELLSIRDELRGRAGK